MLNKFNKLSTHSSYNKLNSTNFKHNLIALSIGAGILLLGTEVFAADAANDSTAIVKTIVDKLTSIIKNEGKLGLQILSAAGGGLAAAKTVSWQPLLVGAGGAAILEVLFSAIK